MPRAVELKSKVKYTKMTIESKYFENYRGSNQKLQYSQLHKSISKTIFYFRKILHSVDCTPQNFISVGMLCEYVANFKIPLVFLGSATEKFNRFCKEFQVYN